MTRILGATAVGVLLAVVATGCTPPHLRTVDATTRPAIGASEASNILERHNAARQEGDRLRDPALLRRVETGTLLDIDAGRYFVSARVTPDEPVDPVRLSDPLDTVAPRFGRYPMWAAVLADDTAGGTRRFVVLERNRSTEPWLMTLAPELAGDSGLPEVAEDDDGAAQVVDAGDSGGLAASPQQALNAYARVLADPEAEDAQGFADDAFVRGIREFQRSQEALPFSSFEQTWQAHQVRHAVRLADGGALVIGALTRTDSYRPQPNTYLDWEGNAAAKAYLPGRVFNQASLTFLHQVLLLLPAEGEISLLGQYGGVVDGQGS